MIEIKPINNMDSEITVPGSKYIANRVLLLAALANGTSKISNVPDNDDINAAIEALKKFNIDINKKNDGIIINGSNGNVAAPNEKINVGNSGTLMRFITGFASLAEGKTTITGSERVKQRPVNELLSSLQDLGINCTSLNKGFLPVEVDGGTLNGGATKIKGNVSSQFISSLLLISPFAKNDIEIIVGNNLVSKNYVDMTIGLMQEFGVNVERDTYKKFIVKAGQKYNAKNYVIPADWSSANYFLAAAAIVPGRIKINDIDSSQKDEAEFVDILEKMGCNVNRNEGYIEINGNKKLNAIEVDMSTMPDSVQTLAAVSVFAKGTTRIKNIGNLKYKESDRINDTAKELKKMKIKTIAKDDELIIEGGNPKSAVIDPHNDHRMAMSFALIGLKTGIKIKNPECVNKSFPQFWDKLKEIGAGTKNLRNIVLMGYRGSGKTVIAKELGKKLNKNMINTDKEIEKKVGSIKDYIEKNGWESFRDIESGIIQNVDSNDIIIDCGGGFIEREINIQNLKKNGIIIWLKAQPPTIKDRIKDNKDRPSLTGTKSFVDEIEEVLKKRAPIYKKVADFEIDTDNKSIEQITDEIISII